MRDFSLTNFFMVTGFSFLAFTGAMRLLDGVTIALLLKIGTISIGLGITAFLFKLLFGDRGNSQMTDD
jgi:hypothetical protein